MLNSNESIIYIDETTFNYHLRQSRVWSYRDLSVKLHLAQKRFSGVTLYGAIGHCLNESVFMTGKSTNIEEFKIFIQKVIAALRNPEDKPYLVLDNHSSHRSLQVRRLLEAHFNVCFIPTQSCELNSIESLWALFKKIFRKKAASLVGTLRNQGEVVSLVESIADEIPERTRIRFCEANRKYLLKLLWQIKQGLIGDTFV